MQLEDEMEQRTADGLRALHNAKPVPTRRLSRARAAAESLEALLAAAGDRDGDAHSLLSTIGNEAAADGTNDDSRPLRHADIVKQEYALLAERNADALDRARNLRADLAPVRASIDARRREVDETIAHLEAFTRELGVQTLASGEVESLADEANKQLHSLRQQNTLLDKQQNYAQKNAE